MARIDIDLSDIDKMNVFAYFRNAEDGHQAQLLGVCWQGVYYRFQLETFHLGEIPNCGKSRPDEHRHAVYHAVLYQHVNRYFHMGREIDAAPGTLALISPGEPHTFGAIMEPMGGYHELTFSLISEAGSPLTIPFDRLLALYHGIDLSITHPVRVAPADHQRLNQDYERLALALKNDLPAFSTAFLAPVATLLSHMTEIISNATDFPGQVSPQLEKVKAFIERRFAEGFDLESLAAKCGMSREHLCRSFKSQFGVAPFEYRQRLRIGAAKRMLSFSDLEIKVIAEQLGFADIYHFTRTFSKSCGISPAKFRRRLI